MYNKIKVKKKEKEERRKGKKTKWCSNQTIYFSFSFSFFNKHESRYLKEKQIWSYTYREKRETIWSYTYREKGETVKWNSHLGFNTTQNWTQMIALNLFGVSFNLSRGKNPRGMTMRKLVFLCFFRFDIWPGWGGFGRNNSWIRKGEVKVVVW